MRGDLNAHQSCLTQMLAPDVGGTATAAESGSSNCGQVPLSRPDAGFQAYQALALLSAGL